MSNDLNGLRKPNHVHDILRVARVITKTFSVTEDFGCVPTLANLNISRSICVALACKREELFVAFHSSHIARKVCESYCHVLLKRYFGGSVIHVNEIFLSEVVAGGVGVGLSEPKHNAYVSSRCIVVVVRSEGVQYKPIS